MKNLFLFLFIIVSCSIKSQSLDLDSLPVYISINEKFDSILFAFIEHEKQYDYFDSTCLFRMIIFNNPDSSTSIDLISGYKRDELPNSVFMFKPHMNMFLIRSNNHYWEVCQRREQSVNTILLSKLDEYFSFCYCVLSTKKKKKESVKPQKTSANDLNVPDDIFDETLWIYEYKDGEFYEIEKQARMRGKIRE